MEITWLGRSCFRLKGREGAVVTDPCPPASGYRLGRPAAGIVTISRRDDPGYSYVEGIDGTPKVLDAPGEYEIGGILVSGVAIKREDGARNVAFVCEIDGIRVGHLGLPSAAPSSAVLEQLDDIDILLVPVGGHNSLAATVAADLVTAIDPRIAIPMNYKTEMEEMELDSIDRFLKETGTKAEPQPRLQVTRSQLPGDLTIMLLQPKQ
ncbi:lactamase [bacterium]|nr:MAG: lactamase [bacterium]